MLVAAKAASQHDDATTREGTLNKNVLHMVLLHSFILVQQQGVLLSPTPETVHAVSVAGSGSGVLRVWVQAFG